MSEEKRRVGRPAILNTNRTFSLNFSNDEEAELLVKAKEKAIEWNIPIKAIILTALRKWVHGTVSFEEIMSGKDTFVIQKKEIIVKAKKSPRIAAMDEEPWAKEWSEGIPG